MKVAGSTRHALRGVFSKHCLAWDWSDSELDRWVRALRTSLSGRPDGVESETAALQVGFLPAVKQLVQLDEVDTFDEEQWCELCWDVLEAATAQTQSFLRFPCLREDGEAWRELTGALRENGLASVIPRTVSTRLVLWSLNGAAVCLLLSTFWVSMSGRSLLWSVVGAATLVTAGEAWRRWGADLELRGGAPFVGRECQRTGPEVTRQAGEEVLGTVRQLSVVPSVGTVVQFKECKLKPELNWCFGVVEGRQGGVLSVCLAGGSLVQGVVPEDVNAIALSDVEPSSVRELLQAQLGKTLGETPLPQEARNMGDKGAEGVSYAPLQGQTRMLEQAKKVKELLVLWHGRSALLPAWARSFWQEVGLLEPLEQRLKALLLSQGYLGRGVGSPPRFKELKEKLEELSTAGAVAHSRDAFRAQEGMAWGEDEEGPESWEAALPPDLKRAGPEIYSSMKASGVRCVRDWVNSMFSVEQRQTAHYVDLFNLATLVDFKAREGGSSQSKVLSIIAQDDTCEVALRRLAAWIHERRTGDRDAAQSMLAIKPSSFSTDVAPSWLVTEAASFSQSEHKRRERARAQGSASHGSVGGSGGGKAGAKGGKGKGKEKKKGPGGKAATQG